MIIELGGILVASAVVLGISIFAAKGATSKVPVRDVLKDYAIIRSALIKYRKDKMGVVDQITDLEHYLEPGQSIQWPLYFLAQEEKFLMTDMGPQHDLHEIANKVGGDSYVMGTRLYLSFSTVQTKKDDDFEPIASFKVYPETITTMTNVTYDTSECKAVDGEILEYKWEKTLPIFEIPGEYLLKLKIRDNKGRWSKNFQKKIVVIRDNGLASVSAGGTSLFVLHKDGRVDGQGTNEYSQLGTGNITPIRDREIIPLLKSIIQVEATDSHTLVRRINGTVYAFGKNDHGQLGTGSKGDVKTPKEIWGLKNIIQISAGEYFSAALDSAGKVYTWGDNQHGQLGGDRIGSRDMPMVLDELSEIKGISLGYNHGLAVRQDGTVYGWGDNEYGQLGLGFKSKQSEIMMSTLKKIDKVIGGKGYSLAIDTQGMVLGWGNNNKNQLGIIGQSEVLFPVEVKGLKHIVDIKTYNNYSLALDKYGKIYTWGQSNVLSDNYTETPKYLDFLPLAKSIAIADRYGYLLTADDRVIRWLGESTTFEEMMLKELSHEFNVQG